MRARAVSNYIYKRIKFILEKKNLSRTVTQKDEHILKLFDLNENHII